MTFKDDLTELIKKHDIDVMLQSQPDYVADILQEVISQIDRVGIGGHIKITIQHEQPDGLDPIDMLE